MASITRIGKGKQPPRAIDFVDPDGKRKRIRIGVVTLEAAKQFKTKVEALLSTKILGHHPDAQTSAWMAELPDDTHTKLVRAGLAEPREPQSETPALEAFLSKHIEHRSHELAASSIRSLKLTAAKLSAFFGPEIRIDAINADKAKDWRASMLQEGLAEASVRLHARNAKTIFGDAVERELIDRQPFAKLKSASIAARRDRYVTSEDTQHILDACPNIQWRLLIGLARYGGLRVPSESHRLTWEDVNWEQRRLTVYAQKTDKTRIIPIDPRLMALLQDAFEEAPEGSVKLLLLSKNNLHRTFKKIITRAGRDVWDDLFQTLRRSCETELAKSHPQHAVSHWIGHSMAVSERHYLQVPDDLYESVSHQESNEAVPVANCAADSAAAEPRTPLQSVAQGSNGPESITGWPSSAQTKMRRKGSSNRDSEVESEQVKTEDGNALCRTRTCDPLIKSQMVSDGHRMRFSDPALRELDSYGRCQHQYSR